MEKVTKSNKEKILYIDILRIVAAIGVILLHVSSQNWARIEIHSFNWTVFNFFNSISRWCVPVFTMISGALFLNNTISIEKMYKKYIFRILTVLVFWSLFYAVFNYINGDTIKGAFKFFIKGHYHLWYLYMVLGLYLIVPLVKPIAENKTLLKYFLVIAIVFTVIIPQIIDVFKLYNLGGNGIMSEVWKNVHFHFTLGYVTYLMLGFYLHKYYDDIKSKEKLLLILALLGFIITIIFSYNTCRFLNSPDQTPFSDFSIGVFLESIGVFILVRKLFENKKLSEKAGKRVSKLSKATLGVYLIHPLFLEQLRNYYNISTITIIEKGIHPIISVIGYTLVVIVAAWIVSLILNKIPKVNKYIV